MTKPDKTSVNEQLIAASEQRLRALVNATSDIVYSLNADWSVMRELDGRGFLKDAPEPTSDWRSDNIYPDDLEMVNLAINEAIQQKKPFQLEHRVLRADRTPGWTFSRAVPILDDNGEIIEWFGVASDITERKLAEEALQEANERSEQQKRLYETITAGTPDLIYVFDLNYRFTYANSALLTMWGKTWDNAIGKSLLENGYEPWHAEMHEREIDQVRTTKKSIRGEVSFPHAVLGKRVYDYIFTPVLNEQGEVEAVAGTTRDVTERKQWELAMERAAEEQQAMNEEMAAINEEMSATNEELIVTNEELTETQRELQKLLLVLGDSEARFRSLVQQAPVAIFILKGREQRIEAMNELMFRMLGIGPEVIGKTYREAMPEFEGQPFFQLIDDVYTSGQAYYGYEILAKIFHEGEIKDGYYNFIYEPIKDDKGVTNSVMCVAIDVTEQVKARKEIEQTKESLQMAIDAAELGAYYINTTDRIFHPSPRLKEFFGFEPYEEVPYEAAINQIHEDYRQAAADLVEAAITKGIRFDMEYPVVGYQDGKLRWVRGIGEVQHLDGKSYFTGVLHDITEKKEDEMRKNDFIGMVSHELKTPLTSLTAILQVLNAKLKKSEDGFVPGALEKANQQVKKMTGMINGFLNISRLESGKILIDKQTFTIGELVKEAIEETNLVGVGHIIDLQTCDKIVVNADRDKIGSVISNLLSNAIKYSPKGSHILVNCRRSENEVLFSVEDEGLGIRPEDREKVFDRFYRVESNYTRHISGFGIGLYLSAEIIRRHNGRIWVESENGKGSTFYFCLPLKNS
jgi:PAS domain S-box-containing protein